MKTGPFFEHSPKLYSIADVPTWNKINEGMMKMYQAEVMAKFPIMQHFLFGSILNFTPGGKNASSM
jgi:serine/threonine-protein phosphatase 2A activator